MRLLLSLTLFLAAGVLVLTVIEGRDKQPVVASAPAATVKALVVKPDVASGVATDVATDVAIQTHSGALPAKGFLYRWRDAAGTIHIQSTPPAPDQPATKIAFDRTKQREAENPEPVGAGARTSSSVRKRLAHPLSVYTPEGFEQLLKDVDATAARLQHRDQTLDRLREDL